MKNKPLFDKTVAILVKAYETGTLAKGNCSACAVSNIIAANMGYKIVHDGMKLTWRENKTFKGNFLFSKAWYLTLVNQTSRPEIISEGEKQIKATGYSSIQLHKIETSFESITSIPDGLIQVVDTLCQIHEMNDEVKAETRALFVK